MKFFFFYLHFINKAKILRVKLKWELFHLYFALQEKKKHSKWHIQYEGLLLEYKMQCEGWMHDGLVKFFFRICFFFISSPYSDQYYIFKEIVHFFRRKKHTSLEEWAAISAFVYAEIASHGQMQGY